jgi:hypothetical protein
MVEPVVVQIRGQERAVLDQEPDNPLVPFLGSNMERST